MESLTNRLIMLMKQIELNQIADLIEENRLENERNMRHEKIGKSFAQNASESLPTIKQDLKRGSKSIQHKKNSKEKKQINGDDMDRQKKLDKLGSIWNTSKTTNRMSTKSNNSGLISNPSDEKKCALQRKFLKVARVLVIVNSIKKGHTICTCSSLDSKCKLHDS